MSDPIESPCLNICRIEPASRLCIGCWRTIDEITQWSRMTAQERRAIIEELPQRKFTTRR